MWPWTRERWWNLSLLQFSGKLKFFLARKEIIPLKKREILLSTSWRSLTNYINLYFCLPYKTQIHGKNFYSSPICTQLSILGRDWKLISLCTHACTQTIQYLYFSCILHFLDKFWKFYYYDYSLPMLWAGLNLVI